MCDAKRDHAALKLDAAAWAALPFVGLQKTYADPGEPSHLEMRNCACGSTLCVPVTREE